MAQRTNRVAWGLAAVLAVVVLARIGLPEGFDPVRHGAVKADR